MKVSSKVDTVNFGSDHTSVSQKDPGSGKTPPLGLSTDVKNPSYLTLDAGLRMTRN